MTALQAMIDELAGYNDDPAAGGITREVYTPTYRRALERVTDWMRDAGLVPRLDAVGNLFGAWEGSEPGAPRVITGSHVDTTLNAGRYDGVLGVLGAIEAVRRLRDDGFAPRRTIEVVAWAGRSRASARAASAPAPPPASSTAPAWTCCATATASRWPRRCARPASTPTGSPRPSSTPRPSTRWSSCTSSRARCSRTRGEALGVVTAIAAPHDFTLTFTGAATHAGATPMRLRRDALAGAAEWMSALERIAVASPSGTTVGTVGVARVAPGAINVVPGTVELDVDIRDADLDAREARRRRRARPVRSDIAAPPRAERERRRRSSTTLPVGCSPTVVAAAEAAVRELGVPWRRMVSGAYHDAMIVGRARADRDALRAEQGRRLSHHPDEYTGAGGMRARRAGARGHAREARGVSDRARLLAVARGDAEPDLVVAGARVFSAFTREWLDGDVAVADGRIAGIGALRRR